MTTTYYVEFFSDNRYVELMRCIDGNHDDWWWYSVQESEWYECAVHDDLSDPNIKLVTTNLTEAILFIIQTFTERDDQITAQVWLEQL